MTQTAQTMVQPSEALKENFRLFTRGLGQNSGNEIYRAHRALYHIGTPVIKHIKEYIQGLDLSVASNPIQAHLISGMFNLLRDIDEEEAQKLAKDIVGKECAPVIARLLKGICEFSVNNYRRYKIGQILVFESNNLAICKQRTNLLTEWLNVVPEADLEDIHRLYVVSRKEIEKDIQGNYMPILFVISIKWWNPLSTNSVVSWPFKYIVQFTLYHEIGHHVHRHTFGNDPDQERQANNYAARLMRKAHPSTSWLIRLLWRD